jgi:hypothetical protein
MQDALVDVTTTKARAVDQTLPSWRACVSWTPPRHLPSTHPKASCIRSTGYSQRLSASFTHVLKDSKSKYILLSLVKVEGYVTMLANSTFTLNAGPHSVLSATSGAEHLPLSLESRLRIYKRPKVLCFIVLTSTFCHSPTLTQVMTYTHVAAMSMYRCVCP